QLSTITGLKPRLRVQGNDEPAVAALKGDPRMAQVIAKAMADRERPLPRELQLLIDGLRIRITRNETARMTDAARRRRGTHNAKRPYITRRLLDVLVERYKAAAVRAYNATRLTSPDGHRVRHLVAPPSVAGALARGDALPEG